MNNILRYECNMCEKKFVHSWTLKDHINKHHTVKYEDEGSISHPTMKELTDFKYFFSVVRSCYHKFWMLNDGQNVIKCELALL